MPNPTSHSGIRDNHRRGVVADFLKARILPGARLSVVSAYFTIYAYDALKAHLDGIEHLNFLFGEPRFLNSLDPERPAPEGPRVHRTHLPKTSLNLPALRPSRGPSHRHSIRGQRVILDTDLAKLYGVQTFRLCASRRKRS